MAERWAAIEGFPDYEISDLGACRRVTKGISTFPGRVLKPIRRGKYWGYSLMMEGRIHSLLGHRLVAIAFIGSPPYGYEVNHIDGDKSNNRLSNLEYVTRSENMVHARDVIGTFVFKSGKDHWAWRGGPPPKVGRPSGERHWMRIKPELIARGDNCGHNKVSSVDVEAIRLRVEAGEMQKTVAAEFGISRAQVCKIVNRKQWV